MMALSSLVAKLNDILPLKPPMERENSWLEMVFPYLFFIGAVVVCVLGALIFKAFLKTRNKREIRPEAVDISPDEWALREIKKVEDYGMEDRNRVKDYYDIMSDVVRMFFERQYGIELMDLTTAELKDRLKPIFSGNIGARELFFSFLYECDMVKFAAQSPDEASVEGLAGRARKIVDAVCRKVV